MAVSQLDCMSLSHHELPALGFTPVYDILKFFALWTEAPAAGKRDALPHS